MAGSDGTGPNKFDELRRSGSLVLLMRHDGKEAWCPAWKWQELNRLYEDMQTFECEVLAIDMEEELDWREPRDPDEDDL